LDPVLSIESKNEQKNQNCRKMLRWGEYPLKVSSQSEQRFFEKYHTKKVLMLAFLPATRYI
jgi:hypothetical protein